MTSDRQLDLPKDTVLDSSKVSQAASAGLANQLMDGHLGDQFQRQAQSSTAKILSDESISEWQRLARQREKMPLAVDNSGTITVESGDCLSVIAERRLLRDGEQVNHSSIRNEETRLRRINAEQHPSLESGAQGRRDFLADGWQLKVYETEADRKRFYTHQPNSWTCGPTSIAMAMADLKLGHPPDRKLIDKISKETGTSSKYGFPDWPNVMPQELKKLGFNAEAHTYLTEDNAIKDEMNDLDHELSLGHVVVIHEDDPLTGNGHFCFVAGRDSEGKYIVGDPNSYSVKIHMDKPVDRSVLQTILSRNVRLSFDSDGNPQFKSRGDYKGMRGFTSVW